ncbi:GntR family transcriptional regulator [Alkalicoccus luteus]|uniref:GntR family transcriptional regulator n=1 Tax=Alkalicoccus luteus TaxID=1237094 RepID=UPI00403389E3
MVNKESSIPIYYQLAEQLRRRIDQGELKPGDMMPSERELSEQFAISRMTVRQAIASLVDDGIVYRKQGTGTFVAEEKIEQHLSGLTSFSEDMRARGMEPSATVLTFEKQECPAEAASFLGLEPDEPVYYMKRLRLADKVPMALEETWLSAALSGPMPEEAASGSLYTWLEERAGIRIGRAEQWMEAAVLSEAEAMHLQAKAGGPVLVMERQTYTADGRPLELVRSRYRADRYRFHLDLPRSQGGK